jgi:hypothetical protein
MLASHGPQLDIELESGCFGKTIMLDRPAFPVLSTPVADLLKREEQILVADLLAFRQA